MSSHEQPLIPLAGFLFFKSQGKVLRGRNCLKVTGRIQKGTHKGQLG